LEQNTDTVPTTEKRVEAMTPAEQQQKMKEILSKIIRDKSLLEKVLNQYNEDRKIHS